MHTVACRKYENKLVFGYKRANFCKVESDEMHTIDLAKLTLFAFIGIGVTMWDLL